MAHNISINQGQATFIAAADEVTFHGQAAKVQATALVDLAGAEDARSASPFGKAATAVVSAVTVSDTVATLSALNAGRKAVLIRNEADVALLVKFGGSATESDYSEAVGPGETLREEMFTGIITGILASGSTPALARVTELSA